LRGSGAPAAIALIAATAARTSATTPSSPATTATAATRPISSPRRPSWRRSPAPLDAAILFAPVGALVPAALRATRKGGRVVCAGIHMSDIPSFPYRWLWGERQIVSVANLTRADAAEFFAVARRVDIRTEVTRYRLEDANRALADLRDGRLQGAAALAP
jgi:propanol-preferring alcohol dehydrogenase